MELPIVPSAITSPEVAPPETPPVAPIIAPAQTAAQPDRAQFKFANHKQGCLCKYCEVGWRNRLKKKQGAPPAKASGKSSAKSSAQSLPTRSTPAPASMAAKVKTMERETAAQVAPPTKENDAQPEQGWFEKTFTDFFAGFRPIIKI